MTKEQLNKYLNRNDNLSWLFRFSWVTFFFFYFRISLNIHLDKNKEKWYIFLKAIIFLFLLLYLIILYLIHKQTLVQIKRFPPPVRSIDNTVRYLVFCFKNSLRTSLPYKMLTIRLTINETMFLNSQRLKKKVK